MKKLKSLCVIIAGLFFLTNLYAQEKSVLLPDGTYGTVGDQRALNDAIFIYSTNTSNNVFILNGDEIPVLKSGWFDDDGSHLKLNQNYICGLFSDAYYNNFFAVDLSDLGSYGITPPITTAVLKVQQFDSDPNIGKQMFNLHEVSTDYATIDKNYFAVSPTGISIYEDLGDGLNIGSYNVYKIHPSSNFIEISLSSDALSAINSSIGGIYIVGGSVESTNQIPLSYFAIYISIFLILAFTAIRFRRVLI